MTPVVVPAYAAILALIFAVLSLRVVNMRRSTDIWLGSGGNILLERRIRIHANFAEYIPFAILLLALAEMQRWSSLLLHGLCLLLLAGRLVHIYSVSQEPEDARLRAGAVIPTWLVLAVTAILLLIGAIRAA
jgi:hypothetical protein